MKKRVLGSFNADCIYSKRSDPGTLKPIKTAVAEGKELICLADSEEDARKTADQYQIILVGYRHGVAVFHTEKDPVQVIEYGIRHNWVRLSLNTTDTTIK